MPSHHKTSSGHKCDDYAEHAIKAHSPCLTAPLHGCHMHLFASTAAHFHHKTGARTLDTSHNPKNMATTQRDSLTAKKLRSRLTSEDMSSGSSGSLLKGSLATTWAAGTGVMGSAHRAHYPSCRWPIGRQRSFHVNPLRLRHPWLSFTSSATPSTAACCSPSSRAAGQPGHGWWWTCRYHGHP